MKVFPSLRPKVTGLYSSTDYNSRDATDVFQGHFPNGASVQNFKHFGQITNGGLFFEYDFRDPELNAKNYPSGGPSRVDLAGLNSTNCPPMYLITARDDTVVYESQIDKIFNKDFVVESYDSQDPKPEEDMAIRQFASLDGDHIVFLLGQEKYMMVIAYQMLQNLARHTGNNLSGYEAP